MRDIRDFRTKAFLKGAVAALERDGFVTDEHSFAPYRDVVVRQVDAIQEFLGENGASFKLGSGELETPALGPVFFIYDKAKLSFAEASERVDEWARQGFDNAEL